MEHRERVIIVGIDRDLKGEDFEASMMELEGLVEASGGEVVGIVTQKRASVQGATYIGKGKLDEIKYLLDVQEADSVIVNDELSGSQMRNLEEILGVKIVDRTNLILDIFALRATSREGLIQVQLAQLKYRLPRLQGFYGALSRTGGGIGTRGPGEQQIDTDRRHIQRQIHYLEKQLQNVVMSRDVNRKRRQKSGLPIIAFVGYTNAGKSSLMNAFMNHGRQDTENKNVFVKDMLFATLDATFRKISLNNGLPVLLSDTVGFVSRLPHDLVAAFRSTLEEITYADLVIHVVDASSSNMDVQMKTTQEILNTFDLDNVMQLTIFNKMDLLDVDYQNNQATNPHQIYGSAHSPYDVDRMLDVIEDKLMPLYTKKSFLIPYDSMRDFDAIASTYDVQHMEQTEAGVSFQATLSLKDAQKYDRYIKK